ncbi:MAG: HAD-IIB family hydrolase [Methylomonas sp.]|jgi:mannosyl-3-phosphoglycerate phosphatase family protein|uniref:HAD-IIB family hydrolase n=1 Tax=Methylomonas sp. TaxID=418 RepID=UPI0025DACEEC|nr:HAD-IIB family hydrolase [Methylomonas sp.]MCK9607672.1 HAD-IIB family hydrolase [Methylomonas sp.]
MSSPHTAAKLLIFTDLDGCLLNHHDYGFAPAAALLHQLERLHIPVIPNSSKTAAELHHLRKNLDNSHPFIIENGAAVFIPIGYFPEQPEGCDRIGDFWVKTFSLPRRHWLELLERSSFGTDKFQNFANATLADIVKLTDLTADAAARAAQRHYGEPLAWRGTDAERAQFIAELRQLGAKVMEGGRFIHVSGDCDKGKAMSWLAEQYQLTFQTPVMTIAAGDGQNDIAMLESADIAVLIPSPNHALPVLEKQRQVYTATRQGPTGWAESVSTILTNLNLQ